MTFIIQEILKPSTIDNLYEEMSGWAGYIEDDWRRWWVAYPAHPPHLTHKVDWCGFAGVQLDLPNKTVMMTPCEVKSEYRGKGLQRQFLKVREDWAIANGYETAISLTLAENLISANNLIKCGYLLRKPIFGGNGKGLYFEKKLTKNNEKIVDFINNNM